MYGNRTKKRVGQVFTYRPVILDQVWARDYYPRPGDLVRIIHPYGCPRPGTMGMYHIEDAKTREFRGLVFGNSLVKEN